MANLFQFSLSSSKDLGKREARKEQRSRGGVGGKKNATVPTSKKCGRHWGLTGKKKIHRDERRGVQQLGAFAGAERSFPCLQIEGIGPYTDRTAL